MHFRTVFLSLLLLSLLFSVLLGNTGIMLPAVPLVACCFAMRYPLVRILPWCIAASSCLDALWRHCTPQISLTVLAVCGAAALWRRRGDAAAGATVLLGGLLCGVAANIFAGVEALTRPGEYGAVWYFVWSRGVFSVLACVLLLPLLAWSVDAAIGHRIEVCGNTVKFVHGDIEE